MRGRPPGGQGRERAVLLNQAPHVGILMSGFPDETEAGTPAFPGRPQGLVPTGHNLAGAALS